MSKSERRIIQSTVFVVVVLAFLVTGFLNMCVTEAPQPNFVIFSVDTLRADHLGCYGNNRWDRSPSPVADALAARGVLFEECTVPRGQTHPAIASMLSGRYPITHGLRENGQRPGPEFHSFVEHLRSSGYATAGFAANLKKEWSRGDERRVGWWTAGFESVGDGFSGDPLREIKTDPLHQSAWDQRVEEQALRWIEQQRTRLETPFLLWVHFYDVHKPYTLTLESPRFDPGYDGPLTAGATATENPVLHPDPLTAALNAATLAGKPLAPRDQSYVMACYDAGIAGVDSRIGRILQALETAGLNENTWTVYTSDHGEELGDHNDYYYHGASIYDSVLRIPLIFSGPTTTSPRRIKGLVQNVDLAPTILELAGIKVSAPPMEGRSFAELLEDDTVTTARHRELALAEWQDLIYAVSDGHTKYIFNPEDTCPVKPPWKGRGGRGNGEGARGFRYAVEEIYDLGEDPLEQRNLIDSRRNQARFMQGMLKDWLARLPVGGGRFAGRDIEADERWKLLEGLGY